MGRARAARASRSGSASAATRVSGYEHDRDVAYMRAMREGLGPDAVADDRLRLERQVGRDHRRPARPGVRGVRPRLDRGATRRLGSRGLRQPAVARRRRRIAYGEKEWDLAGFERILATGTVDVVGIDPGRAEGITGFRRAADAHRVRPAPGQRPRLVDRHLLRGQPGDELQLAGFKLFELKPLRNPMQHDLVTEPFGHVDGWVYPPTGPGLGIEVIEEVVDRYRSERGASREVADRMTRDLDVGAGLEGRGVIVTGAAGGIGSRGRPARSRRRAPGCWRSTSTRAPVDEVVGRVRGRGPRRPGRRPARPAAPRSLIERARARARRPLRAWPIWPRCCVAGRRSTR